MKKLALAFLIVACSPAAQPAAVAPPTAPAAAPIFELGELTLLEAGTPVVKLHADGTTEIGVHHGSMTVAPGAAASSASLPVALEPGPTFAVDGSITHGKLIARLAADGTIHAYGRALPIVVTADRVMLTKLGAAISIDADGQVHFSGGDSQAVPDKLRVEGASTPGLRRTVLTLLAVLLTPPE